MYDEETIPAGFESWDDLNDYCNQAEQDQAAWDEMDD